MHGTNNGGAFVEKLGMDGKAVNLNGNKWINVDDKDNGQSTFDTGAALSVSLDQGMARRWMGSLHLKGGESGQVGSASSR